MWKKTFAKHPHSYPEPCQEPTPCHSRDRLIRASPNQNGRSRAWAIGHHFGMRKAINKALGAMVGTSSFGQVCNDGSDYRRSCVLLACIPRRFQAS
ncbi:hypothetical protein V8C26DRAFT_417619 [Trichoderma gracile]